MNSNGIRFTAEERERLRAEAVRLYGDGLTTTDVGTRLGCSSGAVSKFLAEAGVATRPRRKAQDLPLGDDLLTSAQVAVLAGIQETTFAVLCSRGKGPKRAKAPAGTHRHWRFFDRRDVEVWLSSRQERRRRTEERAAALRDAAQDAVIYTPDWAGLLTAVNAKRRDHGLTWQAVCVATGINESVISRIRNGKVQGPQWTPFLRLVAWLNGRLPDGIREYLNSTPATTATNGDPL